MSFTESGNNPTMHIITQNVYQNKPGIAPAQTVKPSAMTYKEVAAQVKKDMSKIAAKELESSRLRMPQMMQQLSQANKKKTEDPLEVHRKCLNIAMRIMKGKKVSQAELKLLMENDPGLYFMAILFSEGKVNLKKDEDEEKLPDGNEAQSDDGSQTDTIADE